MTLPRGVRVIWNCALANPGGRSARAGSVRRSRATSAAVHSSETSRLVDGSPSCTGDSVRTHTRRRGSTTPTSGRATDPSTAADAYVLVIDELRETVAISYVLLRICWSAFKLPADLSTLLDEPALGRLNYSRAGDIGNARSRRNEIRQRVPNWMFCESKHYRPARSLVRQSRQSALPGRAAGQSLVHAE
jgi:hypothetical protein